MIDAKPQNTDLKPGKYKSPKRLEVMKWRVENPNMTLEQIGHMVELTKERVRQILASENLSTKSKQNMPKPLPPCKNCGEIVPHRRLKYCSNKCRYPDGITTFICSYCGIESTIMTSEYKNRISRYDKIHCSRYCRDNARRTSSNKQDSIKIVNTLRTTTLQFD